MAAKKHPSVYISAKTYFGSFLKGGTIPQPSDFLNIFVVVITFFTFLLCK